MYNKLRYDLIRINQRECLGLDVNKYTYIHLLIYNMLP